VPSTVYVSRIWRTGGLQAEQKEVHGGSFWLLKGLISQTAPTAGFAGFHGFSPGFHTGFLQNSFMSRPDQK